MATIRRRISATSFAVFQCQSRKILYYFFQKKLLFFVHIWIIVLAKNVYFMILSTYFDCIFGNFVVNKCINITEILRP